MGHFDLEYFWHNEADEHENVARDTFKNLMDEFGQMLNICAESIQSGGKILFFGNGGSAADAQHLATELAVRYVGDRAAIAALALTTDTSTLTAIGNDYGFDHLFARQIEAMGKPGDVAIGISTSGNSENVLKALATARTMGLKTIAFTGKDGGKIPALNPDVTLTIPSDTTARIQEMHITLGQMLCGALEQRLGLI
ncbi:MAG: phosphoheptose isomerase [Micavibrio sp.]|nr:phosphoheptose isomerase [Micavibrio sp.]